MTVSKSSFYVAVVLVASYALRILNLKRLFIARSSIAQLLIIISFINVFFGDIMHYSQIRRLRVMMIVLPDQSVLTLYSHDSRHVHKV